MLSVAAVTAAVMIAASDSASGALAPAMAGKSNVLAAVLLGDGEGERLAEC